MQESSQNIEFSFKTSKQDRARKTLEDIIQAASELVEIADPDLFTSRYLSKKSGYALGTLSKHLGMIDNVFLWVILKGRDKNVREAQRIIDEFSPDEPLLRLLEQLVDKAFQLIQKVNPTVIRFCKSRAFKRTDTPWDMNTFSDPLVPSWLKAIERDKTETFARLSEEEVRWCLRTTIVFIEHPFVELNPIAGTEIHRKIALERLTVLLGKN